MLFGQFAQAAELETLKPIDSSPEITILSTMVANFSGMGEWGFSALVETAEEKILFDTGFKQATVFNNAKALGLDLTDVTSVILTHFHLDHTGGLLELRRRYREVNPSAFTKVYVGKGFFRQRYVTGGTKAYSLAGNLNPDQFQTPEEFRAAATALGITFTVLNDAQEIAPGIVLTGPIERIHPEKNVSPGYFLDAATKQIDYIPESQVLGILRQDGWLMISGCGHAGIINAASALQSIRDVPVTMAIGGFHLFRASREVLAWTADELKRRGITSLVGAHCTGIPATNHLKQALQLANDKVSVGAIGTRIDTNLNIIRSSIE